MGNEPLGSIRYWCYTNPDNYNAQENCAAVDVPGWFDCSCAAMFPFICFDGTEQVVFLRCHFVRRQIIKIIQMCSKVQ